MLTISDYGVRMMAMGKRARLWAVALPCLLAGQSAWAACPAANQYSYAFANATAGALAYGTPHTVSATSTALPAQNVTFSWTTNGLDATTGYGYPLINNGVNGGTADTALIIGGTFSARTADVTSNTRVIVTTVAFATAVRDATLTLSDIDQSTANWRDWVHVVGIGPAGNYVPVLTTPHGQTNGGTLTSTNSSLTLGATTGPPAATIQQAVGLNGATDTTNRGNMTISFAQPVTSIQVRYGNYPLIGSETGTTNQHMAFLSLSYCPMPVVSMTKTSAPWSDPQNGTTNPKLIPGGDLTYTLTVSNSNSSPVDASTIVLTDPLPSTLTFYNGDIDDAGPLTTNYEFNAGASTLTFAAANLTYSNTASPGPYTYGYTPAAGYDANVTAIRLAPQGTMAANSSFTLKFRARIK